MGIEFRYFILPKILAGIVIVLAVVLGLIMSGYTPLDNILHLKTTVPYYVTVPITRTTTIINETTIVVNHTLTTTTQAIVTSIVTSTMVINNTITITNTTTVRGIIIQPVTTTITTTTTTVTPIYYTTTTTMTETITSTNITLPPLDPYNASSIEDYLVANWTLGWDAFIRNQNLTQYGFCIGTLYILPNASVIWLGVWFMPWWYALQFMNNQDYVITFSGGYSEYFAASGGLYYLPPGTIYPITIIGGGSMYLVNVNNYPLPNYTVVITGEVGGGGITINNMQWDFENLQNGTYVFPFIPPRQGLILVPDSLCLVQVIRVNPNTPANILLNMTFLGAQYWAWVRSIAQYGKPAPCYEPFEWTIGWWLYRMNITEPIGANWQYYCGENGIWRNLKP